MKWVPITHTGKEISDTNSKENLSFIYCSFIEQRLTASDQHIYIKLINLQKILNSAPSGLKDVFIYRFDMTSNSVLNLNPVFARVIYGCNNGAYSGEQQDDRHKDNAESRIECRYSFLALISFNTYFLLNLCRKMCLYYLYMSSLDNL